MSYADQDMFFSEAYKTGKDFWTKIPFDRNALKLMLFIPKGSHVLDIGAGRGHLLRELGNFGFSAIGLENNEKLVIEGNNDLKIENLDKDLRFVYGDALSMPFVEKSFDALLDVGFMQHLKPQDFKAYMFETARVLKQGGLFFLAVLSKETQTYFKWSPTSDKESDYELQGVHYHFFTEEEINQIFGSFFEVVKIKKDNPFGEKDTKYLTILLKKK